MFFRELLLLLQRTKSLQIDFMLLTNVIVLFMKSYIFIEGLNLCDV